MSMSSKPTIPQPLFPGDRATAPMALEDSSDTMWKQFEELLSAKDMGLEPPATGPGPEAQADPTQPLPVEPPPAADKGYEATQVMPMGQPAPVVPAVSPATSRPSGREITASDVMTLARRNNRACPVPPQWAAFVKLLPVREAQGRRVPPPPPLEGSSWSASSPMQKRLRLRDQIEWAERTGALVAAYEFLAALPEEQWHHF